VWHLCSQAAHLVAQNPNLAILVAFAGAIIEAVAVLGLFIPGTPIVMAVAGAAAMAGLPMLPILVVAVVGAIIGDVCSFWLGSHYSARLRRSWPFATRPGLIARAEAFFARYGTMSVAICRFIPILRSTVPLVAGMAGMQRRRFLISNVLSAFVWAPAHVLPAHFAGLSIERWQTGDWLTPAITVALFAALLGAGYALHKRVARPA
jgi:membrane protein DedA with SNARE-associated domain